MPHYAPELVESVLHDHEYTDKPLRQIAAEHGVNERDITRMRHAAGIPSRRARVRALPPAMREVHEINKRLKAARPAVGRNKQGDAERIAPDDADADGAMRSAYCALQSGTDLRALIGRVARLIEHELTAEESTRAELGMLARTPADLERCARIVASMTRSLRELLRLRAGLTTEQGSNNVDDYPADIDAFRDEFARRIRAFVASRTGAGSAVSAGPADGSDPERS